MEFFSLNRNPNGRGCRPGCGCLIIIILLFLAAGYLFKTFLGGYMPTINLPGSGNTRVEYPETNSGSNDYEYDDYSTRPSTRSSGNDGATINYDNKLDKGLDQEAIKDIPD